MKENVGGADRLVRFVAGPALVLAALGPLGARRGQGAGLAALVAGALITETVITRLCPVNAVVGIDTSRP